MTARIKRTAAGHTDIRTTTGYCHSEKCDEIDEDILKKARKYGENKEQVMGIEPTSPAWKAGVLPLNHTCDI